MTQKNKSAKCSFKKIQFFASNMRCKVCKGWGGEFGDAKGVGPMCSSCYFKKYGTYD